MSKAAVYLKIVLATIFVLPQSASSAGTKPQSTSGVRTPESTWAKKIRQGFNMRIWLSNELTMGQAAWDPLSVPKEDCPFGIGLQYPRESCVEHLYLAGPWIGAIVNGVRRVSSVYARYESRGLRPVPSDTALGPFWLASFDSGGEPSHRGTDDDLDGRVDEDELDGSDNDGDWNPLLHDIGADGVPDSLESGCRGPFDPFNNPDPAFDDFDSTRLDTCHPNDLGAFPPMNQKSRYTERNGLPDHGEPNVDEDYGAISRKDIYVGATDTANAPLLVDHPMGVKTWQRSFAWSEDGASAIIFLEYTFTNISRNIWQDAYLAMFADMDVGPNAVPEYYRHNHAGYDPATRTEYVDNPLDSGSTPLGITLIGTPRQIDSLRLIARWFNPEEGLIHDSVLYAWLTGDAFPGEWIRPNQSPDSLSDPRVLMSVGPFDVGPGDTMHLVCALVSGRSIDAMLATAARAHRIYNRGYFVPPVFAPDSSGDSTAFSLQWSPIERSPFGPVTSYRVYYGTSSAIYTDSIESVAPTVALTGLTPGRLYYFAVAAIDDRGTVSALSDEIRTAPLQLIPATLRLHEAFPNPFNPLTTIRYDIPTAGDISLAVYDILGRLRATLVRERKEAGYYETVWNASEAASGVYFIQLETRSLTGPERSRSTMKVILVK